eukprot:CAMPEP_0201696498 /NCGR_PEP_ID=MMETSP0578-20130828/8147_1 /ASSEMBLY_ACC=CAM_ASM_000663 /TAXON_ID=267565 /ORGANISM="Skeletonema grethea, Strain CCMP 1804" /LENGTH=132 /DNA_ID=CAMNT_0048182499 /DNA_START=192 /DNA_END=590 /DNA_ORIENTATION=+
MNGKGAGCDWFVLLVFNPVGICCCCCRALFCLVRRLCLLLLRLFLLVFVFAADASSSTLLSLTLELSFSTCVPSSPKFWLSPRLRRKLLLPRLFTDDELLGTTATCGSLIGDDDVGSSMGFEDMLKSSMMRS